MRTGDYTQMAFFVTSTGTVQWAKEAFPATPTNFGDTLPTPAPFIIDLDAGWTFDGKVFVVAVDFTGQMYMRTQTSTSGNNWNNWVTWGPALYNAPGSWHRRRRRERGRRGRGRRDGLRGIRWRRDDGDPRR